MIFLIIVSKPFKPNIHYLFIKLVNITQLNSTYLIGNSRKNKGKREFFSPLFWVKKVKDFKDLTKNLSI